MARKGGKDCGVVFERSMPRRTGRQATGNDLEENGLPLPAIRCLTKEQAAEYLGIGVTLLTELGVPYLRMGRRCVYDKVDLDWWLLEYKQRGRAGKDGIKKWPVKPESTGGKIRASGGSMLHYRTASEYAKALGLRTERKPKPSSPS